jgi:hypothetical protein
MPQLSKGDTFSDGQQVTGTRLNNLIDGATLLAGAVSDQPSITANTLESTDNVLVSDAGVLKKATIGDILNSELDASFDVATIATLKSGRVEGVLGSDVNLIPIDGTVVTGKSFTSVDGITAIVTSVAHGLVSNMFLTFSASNALYSGTYLITVLSVDTFSYVISQTTPVAASGVLDYVKKGSVNVDGNVYVGESMTVNGNTRLNTLEVQTASFPGNSNFTGTLQVNGQVGYMLIGITEHAIPQIVPTTNVLVNSMYTSPTFTKPSDEIWVFELIVAVWGRQRYSHEWAGRYGSQTPQVGAYLFYTRLHEEGGFDAITNNIFCYRWVAQNGVSFTNETIRVDGFGSTSSVFTFGKNVGTGYVIPNTCVLNSSFFRIYRYKTA